MTNRQNYANGFLHDSFLHHDDSDFPTTMAKRQPPTTPTTPATHAATNDASLFLLVPSLFGCPPGWGSVLSDPLPIPARSVTGAAGRGSCRDGYLNAVGYWRAVRCYSFARGSWRC